MAKYIAVMVPIHVEVDVTSHGELKLTGGITWPALETIRASMTVIPETLAYDESGRVKGNVLDFFGTEYAIIQRG